jgi:hypothetical protein
VTTTEEDGYWLIETAGGQLLGRAVEPDTIGPLIEPPRLVLRWVVPESDERGRGQTEFLRLEAGWVTFTVRVVHWQPLAAGPGIAYEAPLRDPASGEFVNPDPPAGVWGEVWTRGGRLEL